VITTLNAGLAVGSRLLENVASASQPRCPRRCITAAIALAVLCLSSHWPAESYAYLVKTASALLVTVYLLFVLAATMAALRAARKSCIGPILAVSLASILASMAWVPQSHESLLSALCLVAFALLAAVSRHAGSPAAPS
jgi:L-asparagine transporter-like permease